MYPLVFPLLLLSILFALNYWLSEDLFLLQHAGVQVGAQLGEHPGWHMLGGGGGGGGGGMKTGGMQH